MPKVSDMPRDDKKLLIICGPTATGKTSLAGALAIRRKGELINADSRQVYRELTVLSGKDIHPDDTFIERFSTTYKGSVYHLGTYTISGAPIWMYDVVSVTESFSISHYYRLASQVIADVISRGKLPVVVGGTGLYLKTLIRPPETLDIPPDPKSRLRWETMTVAQLQKELRACMPDRLSRMNTSDRANPRRLIRAIEIARWRASHVPLAAEYGGYDTLWVGLKPNFSTLLKHIQDRVTARWTGGAVDEVRACMKKYGNIRPDIGLGISEIISYINGDMDEAEARESWARSEYAYAKRQMTWFRKQPHIRWFDAGSAEDISRISDMVAAWYT